LLEGKPADVVLTDPPFNVTIDGQKPQKPPRKSSFFNSSATTRPDSSKPK
jgi:hypothetical protein